MVIRLLCKLPCTGGAERAGSSSREAGGSVGIVCTFLFDPFRLQSHISLSWSTCVWLLTGFLLAPATFCRRQGLRGCLLSYMGELVQMKIQLFWLFGLLFSTANSLICISVWPCKCHVGGGNAVCRNSWALASLKTVVIQFLQCWWLNR